MSKSRYLKRVSELLNTSTSKSISALLLSNLTISVIGFLTSILVLRKLDKEPIGLLYPLLSILMLVEQIGDLGLSFSLIKIASSSKAQKERSQQLAKTVFKVKVLLALLISSIGFLISPYLCHLIFNDSAPLYWVRVTLLISFFSILSGFFQAYLQIEQRFLKLSLAKVIPTLVKFSLLIFFWNSGTLTFGQVFIAFTAVPIGTCLLSAFFSGTSFLKTESSFKTDFPEVFHFTKWVLLSTIAVSFLGQMDLFMLRSMKGAEEVARYVGGSRLASILLVMTSAALTVLLPKVSSYKTRRELRLYFHRTLLLIPPLAFLVVVASLAAPWFVPFLLGDKYVTSVSVFIIFCFQFAVDLFCAPLSLILYNLNKVSLFAWMNISQFFILCLSNYLLLPSLGAEGAAISGLIIRCFGLLLVLWVCKQEKIIELPANHGLAI